MHACADVLHDPHTFSVFARMFSADPERTCDPSPVERQRRACELASYGALASGWCVVHHPHVKIGYSDRGTSSRSRAVSGFQVGGPLAVHFGTSLPRMELKELVPFRGTISLYFVK